jgi:4'-phosphopantetheinyl transferase
MLSITTWPPDQRYKNLLSTDIHIWRVSLNVPPAMIERLSVFLASDEMEKAVSYRFPREQNQYKVVRGTLRMLLGFYLDCPPESIEFVYSDHGKPLLRRSGPQKDIRFNCSHSGSLGLIGITTARDIGVDIETIRPLDNIDGMANSVFSTNELRLFSTLNENDKLTFFYDTWVRKEALNKARGVGITESFCSINVSDVAIVTIPDKNNKNDPWVLRMIECGKTMAGAWSWRGEGPVDETFFDFTPDRL